MNLTPPLLDNQTVGVRYSANKSDSYLLYSIAIHMCELFLKLPKYMNNESWKLTVTFCHDYMYSKEAIFELREENKRWQVKNRLFMKDWRKNDDAIFCHVQCVFKKFGFKQVKFLKFLLRMEYK